MKDTPLLSLARTLPLCAILGCASHPEAASGDNDHHGHHGERPAHQHRFDDAERWAKEFDDPGRNEWQKPEEVVDKMGLGEGMGVADIGAGTGYFLPHLSSAVGPSGKVYAVDIEPKLVQHMTNRVEQQRLENTSVILAEPDDPKLGPESVDRILIVNTWHHIQSRVEYGRKLAHALRAGGAVCIVDYTRDSPKGPPKEHRLSPEELSRELTEAGLSAEIIQEDLPLQYMVVGRKP